MFKSAIAAVVAAPFLATSALAGPYVNVESNAGFPDGEYSGATTDLHVGFEGTTDSGQFGYYAQVGPGFVHDDAADETQTEISGKVGVSVAATEDLAIYGEIAGITSEDTDGDDIINWGGKIGAKYTF